MNKIAKWLKGLYGTTVEVTGELPKNPNRISGVKPRAEDKKKTKIDRFFAKLEVYTMWFAKWLSKLFASAIVLYFLAGLVPELRENIPSVYRLVDAGLSAMEWIYSIFWQMIDQIIHFFGA